MTGVYPRPDEGIIFEVRDCLGALFLDCVLVLCVGCGELLHFVIVLWISLGSASACCCPYATPNSHVFDSF